jgi:hypothetical protein
MLDIRYKYMLLCYLIKIDKVVFVILLFFLLIGIEKKYENILVENISALQKNFIPKTCQIFFLIFFKFLGLSDSFYETFIFTK